MRSFFKGLSAIVLSEAAVLVFGETVNPFVIGNYMFTAIIENLLKFIRANGSPKKSTNVTPY